MPGWLRSMTQAIGSLCVAFALSLAVIAAIGADPQQAMSAWWRGALIEPGALPESLLRACPLIFSGLAVAVGMQAGLLNIGVEGQLLLGGLASAAIGMHLQQWPTVPAIIVCCAGGIGAGALWGLLPGVLKAWRGAHEVITTIMLNMVAAYTAHFLVVNWLDDPESMAPQTSAIALSAQLPLLFDGTRLHAGILVAVCAALVLGVWLFRSVSGYEARLSGVSPGAADASGVDRRRITWSVMTLSGGIAGLAGALEVLGLHHRFIEGFTSGYGFDGIAVALLAGNHPVYTVLSGVLFGALQHGAVYMQTVTTPSVPREIAQVVQALVIVTMAGLWAWRRRST